MGKLNCTDGLSFTVRWWFLLIEVGLWSGIVMLGGTKQCTKTQQTYDYVSSYTHKQKFVCANIVGVQYSHSVHESSCLQEQYLVCLTCSVFSPKLYRDNPPPLAGQVGCTGLLRRQTGRSRRDTGDGKIMEHTQITYTSGCTRVNYDCNASKTMATRPKHLTWDKRCGSIRRSDKSSNNSS